METMRKFFLAIAILLLLVVATEALAPAQSSVRPCETKSLRFEGFCMVEDNCANVCRTEGFVDGRCSTFVRNCICIKPC
uniref:Knottins-like domain-containing protein n=1 Tax=Oryza rufipogon TaxID=4529 RepID=A0A0E0P5N1_ORYRU